MLRFDDPLFPPVAAPDAEAHMVHRGEIAESLSKAIRLDSRWFGRVEGLRANHDWLAYPLCEGANANRLIPGR